MSTTPKKTDSYVSASPQPQALLPESELFRLNELMAMPYWRDDDSQKVRPIIVKLLQHIAFLTALPRDGDHHPEIEHADKLIAKLARSKP